MPILRAGTIHDRPVRPHALNDGDIWPPAQRFAGMSGVVRGGRYLHDDDFAGAARLQGHYGG